MANSPLSAATVVFDLDGTLVDTAPDLTNALNQVLRQRGHAPVSAEIIRSAVGMGARVMIEDALSHAGATDDIDAMLDQFLVHYEANIANESRPFPGAAEAIDDLKAAGARLAVCTNKREYLSRKLLKELGLECHFRVIAGRDTFACSKPDPRHLTDTIRLAGGRIDRALMIGDSEVDLRTAKSAGVPIVMVSFGYPRGRIPVHEADGVIDYFGALPALAHRLLGRPATRVAS